MRSSLSRLWKWACMIKWFRATPCSDSHPTSHVRTRQLARDADGKTTQRTHTTQKERDGRIVCESRATTDICFMQWWSSSSHLCGGGGKVGTEGGRGSLSVRRREQPGLQIATIRDTKEGNASDTVHTCSGIVGCQCREGAMSILLTGATGLGFCASVGRTRTLSSGELVRR